jgi:hypothetical protein
VYIFLIEHRGHFRVRLPRVTISSERLAYLLSSNHLNNVKTQTCTSWWTFAKMRVLGGLSLALALGGSLFARASPDADAGDAGDQTTFQYQVSPDSMQLASRPSRLTVSLDSTLSLISRVCAPLSSTRCTARRMYSLASCCQTPTTPWKSCASLV